MARYFSKLLLVLTSSLILVVLTMIGLGSFATLPSRNTQTLLSNEAQPTADLITQDSPAERVGDRDFGAWSYRAFRRGGKAGVVEANVRFDGSTKDALIAYRESNRTLVDDLAAKGGTTNVIVTFRRVLEPKEFQSWIETYGVQVNLTSAWTGDGSIGLVAKKDTPLLQTSSGRNILGVYSIDAELEAKQLPKVASDPLVFITDVTPAVIRQDLAAAGITYARISVYFSGGSPFWQGQQFGLVQAPATQTVPTAQSTAALPLPALTGVPTAVSEVK